MKTTLISSALTLLITLIANSAFAVSAVSFDLPQTDTKINLQNVTRLYLQGNCDAAGDIIKVSVGPQSTVSASCDANKVWSLTNLSVAALPDGPIDIQIVKASDPTTSIRRTFIKDTWSPVLVVNAPKNGDSIISTNASNFPVNGICSEVGQPIELTIKRAINDGVAQPITQSLTCPVNNKWSATFNLTSLGDNTDIQFIAIHSDSAGNQNIQSASYYMDVQVIATGFVGLPVSINSSNAATLLLNGTCNKNNSSVSLRATVAGTNYEQNLTTNCMNGLWQFNSMSFAGASVPDGTISLSLTLLNPLTGEIGTTSTSLIKDTVPPTLTITSPANGYRMTVGTGTTLAIAGTCSENGRDVSITGSASATAKCNSGAFTSSLDLSKLADGDLSFTVTAGDLAGNTRTQSFSINKDTNPPRVTINPLNIINATNATSMVLSGTCTEFGAYAQSVTISGAITATAACQAGGTWSLNLSSFSVADGSVTFKADHSDAAGNSSPQAAITVTKDTVPPTLTITSPVLPASPAKFTIYSQNVSNLLFGGSCSKDGASITASGSLTGSAICSNKAWTMGGGPIVNVADGDLKISFKIADAAGNSSQQDIIIFKDTKAPTLTLVGSPFSVNIASVANVTMSGACSEYGSFAQPVTIGGIGTAGLTATCTNGAWTLSVAKTNFVEGATNFTVNHKDVAGNSTSVAGSVTKDSLPPTITIKSTVSIVNMANAASVPISGTCSEAGRSVNVGGAASATASCASGIWSATLNLSNVTDGNLSFSATQTDAAGNSATQNLVLVKDTKPPTIAVTSPTEGQDVAQVNSFNIAGSCSDNGQAVALSGSFTGSSTCTGGAWSISVAASGVTAAAVTATLADAAGNTASVVRNFKNTKAEVLPLLDSSIIGTGGRSSCAVDNGALKCWGEVRSMGLKESPEVIISSGVKKVYMTEFYSCAILVGGELRCWGLLGGSGGVGVGDGTTNIYSTPTTIISSGVTAVGIGPFGKSIACAVVNGALKCWGAGGGQLGDPSIPNNQAVLTPRTIIASDVEDVSVGSFITCALVKGSLQCWGTDPWGSIGDGTTSSATPKTIISSGVQAVSVGYSDTCVIMSGALKCWGSNFNSKTPKIIIESGVQAVSVGQQHRCAIVRGALQCWGKNYQGALGDGTTNDSLVPKTIIGSGVQAVAVSNNGLQDTCAIINGELKCWGSNYYGQLGNGKIASFARRTLVASGGTDAQAQYYLICTLVAGALKCSGNNSIGGIIPNAGAFAYDFTNVIDKNVNSFSIGREAMCAIIGDARSLNCWGSNGPLGNQPGANVPPTTYIDSGVNSVSVGDGQTCAIVGDALKCWGKNSYGEVGSGSKTSSNVPLTIISSGVQSVVAAQGYTCAIVSGALKCWGYNWNGKLGDGTTNESLVPKTIIDSGVTAVSAANSHTCAIVNGALYCWGYNEDGQLGDGTKTPSSKPKMIIQSGVTSVSVGAVHTCAIVNSALYCWGSNVAGQFGDETSVSSLTPKLLISSGVSKLGERAFDGRTCAVINGASVCWGSRIWDYYASSLINYPGFISTPGPAILTGIK